MLGKWGKYLAVWHAIEIRAQGSFAAPPTSLVLKTRKAAEAAKCPVDLLPYPGLTQPRPGVTEADFIGGLRAVPAPAAPAPARPAAIVPSPLTLEQHIFSLTCQLDLHLQDSIKAASQRRQQAAREHLYAAAQIEAELEVLYAATQVCWMGRGEGWYGGHWAFRACMSCCRYRPASLPTCCACLPHCSCFSVQEERGDGGRLQTTVTAPQRSGSAAAAPSSDAPSSMPQLNQLAGQVCICFRMEEGSCQLQ